MRKTASLREAGAVLRARVEPLSASSVSTTIRLPIELADYLVGMVSSGEARDKTDAIVRCVRRHQEMQLVRGLGHLEAGQADLLARLTDITDQLQGMRDDLVLVGSRSDDGLAGIRQNLAALLAVGLYGPLGGGRIEAGDGIGVGPAAVLPLKLMNSPAPAPVRRNKP